MKIRLWPTLMTFAMLAVLLGLGTWQVRRLHWKEDLIATINQRIHQTPLDLDHLSPADDLDYRPVVARGVFQNNHIFYWIAISQTGQGGYRVLTPLALADGRFLLIDRGWIPYERKQSAQFSQPADPVSVTGILRKPEHYRLQSQNQPAQNNWYWIDLTAMAQQAGIGDFLPYVLEADATPNAGGFPLGGQTRIELPNNHLAYAMTWFGMIPVLLIIYGLSSFRKNAAD